MASLAVRTPGVVVSSQASELTSFNMKSLNAVPNLRRQRSFWALHEKYQFRFLSSSCSQVKQAAWTVMSVSEESAATETEGGVFEVEDEATFEQYLREAGDKLVVLDISTKTCGPCKMIYPKVVKMSKEYPNAVFLKVFGDLNSGTRAMMRKWGVRAVPNFRFFRNGELIHSHTGANEDELRSNFVLHYEKPA